MGSRRGEENHVIAVTRQATGTCRLSEDALATVAVDGIAKTLSAATKATLPVSPSSRLATRKRRRELLILFPREKTSSKSCFDLMVFILCYLDGELVTALGTTTSEHQHGRP